MNTSIKQTWSRDDIVLVTRCYLEGRSLQETLALMPDIKLLSLKTKFANCLYLDKTDGTDGKDGKGGKGHAVSKLHQDVWDELKGALTVPDVEAASVPDDETIGYWNEHEEDGEEYFMCTGTCKRVCHYEDTDGEGLCGKCQYEIQQKEKSRRK